MGPLMVGKQPPTILPPGRIGSREEQKVQHLSDIAQQRQVNSLAFVIVLLCYCGGKIVPVTVRTCRDS